jgi:hypothetical protein
MSPASSPPSATSSTARMSNDGVAALGLAEEWARAQETAV